jgi:hypothetical protein
MPLTMRATGLALPVDKDRQDFTIYCGAWPIGRIYEQRGGPQTTSLVLVAGRVVGKPPKVHTSDV